MTQLQALVHSNQASDCQFCPFGNSRRGGLDPDHQANGDRGSSMCSDEITIPLHETVRGPECRSPFKQIFGNEAPVAPVSQFSIFFFFSLSTLPPAPDEAPGQATGWRRGRGEGDQGASVLPLDRLGPTGETGDPSALHPQICQWNRWTRSSVSLPGRVHGTAAVTSLHLSCPLQLPSWCYLLSSLLFPFHPVVRPCAGSCRPALSATEQTDSHNRQHPMTSGVPPTPSICRCMSSLAHHTLVFQPAGQWRGAPGGS